MSKTQIKTNVKAGSRAVNHTTTRIKTKVRAGAIINHNSTRVKM